MIIEKKLSWLQLLFRFHGSSLESTWKRILLVTGVAIVVTVVAELTDPAQFTMTTTPFTLIGLALSIFLGFRNNAAYDRFWEGRKLWGALVNTSRSLSRQVQTLCHSDSEAAELEAFRKRFTRQVIAFVHALRHHLRDSDPTSDIEPFLSAEHAAIVQERKHRPLAILQLLGLELADARSRDWIHELNMPAIDQQLVELSNIMGACERIKNTPIPFPYTVLIHRLVAFYCLLLPFGLIDTTHTLTPLVVFFISHAFFGLDDIGDEIEQPFGTDINSLPLSAISRTIEINLQNMIGVKDTALPVAPVDDVLL